MKYKHMSKNMKTPISGEHGHSALSGNARRFVTGSWRLAALALLALLPALGAQADVDDVEVDQSPLIVTEPLPPNIMLMYDDSGSMAWTYLPDNAPKISNSTGRDASKNYQYYDPRVIYEVPPQADGSLYPTPTFPTGYRDPFRYPGQIHTIVDQSDYSERVCTGSGWWDEVCERAFRYTDPLSKQTHYVAVDCTPFDSNCTTDPDVQQNVANWYSYYRKRDLSAKSGIFSAFADISPSFRVGFGSINNRGSSYITNNANFSFSKEGKRLAGVERFGEPSDVGTGAGAGVQREKLWGWLESVNSSGGTPLRRSLKAVGEYYATEDQPWQSGYDDGGSYSSDMYSCRPSFTILLSDGYWNGDSPGVGNIDHDEPPPFEGAGQSNYLADVAFKYWNTDLRTDLKDDVPLTDRDQANWQHMSTFTVGLGVEPSLANDGGGNMGDVFNWARTGDPGPINTGAFKWGGDKIADMAHAAVNGRGDFFSARNPQEFADGLRQALAAIAAVPGAGSTPTFGGGETQTSGTRKYTASYTTGAWTGELKAVGYDEATDTFSVAPWSASAQLPGHASRNIWTTKPAGGSGAVDAIAFDASELSADQIDALEDGIDTSFPVPAADIVSYLRGDRIYEDSTQTPLASVLRKRDTLLGDIVTSTPVVIEDPKADLYKHVLDDTYHNDLDAYDNFVTARSGRTPMVYVAANDGMLHAFDANTGEEVFAFIPGAVVGGEDDASLARLANPEYGVYDLVDGSQPVPHQYYHDGKLTTQNVEINGAWRTVLVGTTGRGTSRTVYALDITDPAVLADPATAGDAILWERSADDGGPNDDWIGMALGRPTISLIEGSGNQGKWVAHVGNGPNSEKNKAALLQFDLEDGTLDVYTAGSMTDNGLAAPYVIQVDNSDGLSEYAFAGDLHGNVWRFDMDRNGGSGELIYVAKDNGGNRQPITAPMFATNNEETGAIWIFFGTGRFLTGSDILETNPQVQTWYGLRALAGPSGLPVVTDAKSRSDLQKREILAEDSVGGKIVRATSLGDASDLTDDGDVGWYMDLVSPVHGEEGERIVYLTQLIAGRLIVNTLIPKSDDPCSTLPAGATLIVDPFSGANPGEPTLDANSDGTIDDSDATTIAGDTHFYNGERYAVGMAGVFAALMGADGNVRLFGTGLDSGEVETEMTAGSSGIQRLNWREIVN